VDFIEAVINPVLFISIFGILTSTGFLIAILYGLKYMLDRKHEVMKIDCHLMKYGGVSLMGVNIFNEDSEMLKKKYSLTMVVLLAFPLVITCLWIFVIFSHIASQ
jgi:prolipoprotein diacylglyceryltransferase